MRILPVTSLVVAALASTFLVASCSSAGRGDDDDDGSTPANDGGNANISYLQFGATTFAAVSASFVSDVLTVGTAGTFAEIDTCVDTATLQASVPAETVSRNVGANVTFTSGGTSIVAPVTQNGADYVYSALPDAATLPLNADYTVTLTDPAVTLTGLHVPVAIGANLVSPPVVSNATSFPNSALAMSWTSTASDEVAVYFVGSGQGAPSWLCRVRDDGSFTVPANVISAIAPSGNFAMYAYQYETADLEGRTVTLFGTTGIIIPYTRN